MSIRPHPTKDNCWIIDVGRGKDRQRIPFDGTLDEARLWEKDLRAQAKPVELIISPKFGETIPHFIGEYKLSHLPRGVSRTLLSLDHLNRHFGNLTFPSVTDVMIERYKAQRLAAGIKHSTVQKELCALSSYLKWAQRKRYIIQLPLIEKFPGKLIKAPLPVIPHQDDIERIINEVYEPWKRTAFRLMLFSGLRRQEALQLECRNVMLERGFIIVMGKGNKQRIVPIIRDDVREGLAEALKAAGTRQYLWINPRTEEPYNDIRDSLKEAAKRQGFSGRVYHHLLRHCFGTYGHEAGLSLRDIQELMGHSTSQVTEVYTHLSGAHLTAALAKWQAPKTPPVKTRRVKKSTPNNAKKQASKQ